MRTTILIAGTLAAALAAGGAHAQDGPALLRDRAPEDRPTLLVVGSGHFNNPGRDVVNVEVPDVLADERQAEIAAVVAELAAFRPTHVAVEWPAARQEALDERYRAYLAGDHELEPREAEQLGFRVAAAAGLDRVDAVDWFNAAPGGEELYDWPSYGQAHGQAAEVAALFDPAGLAFASPALADQTVGEWLATLNEPARLAAGHRIYFDIARIGDDAVQAGTNWVGGWYARNLLIFNALVDLADDPGDRVLVIYGQGHAYLLRQFAVESAAFDLVDVADVLSE